LIELGKGGNNEERETDNNSGSHVFQSA
jgi:hypothetical protein